MNTEKERALAYSLAKEISNEELSQVSGGGGGMTFTNTFKVCGSNNEWDSSMDGSLDW